MKKTLLIALLAMAGLTAARAQYTFDTALEAVEGECSTESTESTGYVYWKYTAQSDQVIVATDLNNSYTVPDAYTYGSSTKLNHAYWSSGTQKAWNLAEGETVYLAMKAKLNKTVGFTLLVADWTPADKTSATTPIDLQTGKNYLFGDCHTTGTQNAYATYTAPEDGTFTLTLEMSCSSVSFNGTKVAATAKQYTQDLTQGQTLQITLTNTKPVAGHISFTPASGTTEPTEGTLDRPFTLNEGDNQVPAAAGKYYYTTTPAQAGHFTISSDEALERGYVRIYNLLSGITYNSAAAASAVGAFDVSCEVTAAATEPYYVEVTKNTATSESQTFQYHLNAYTPGEKADQPIDITLPTEQTLPSAVCKRYYRLTVPAQTQQLLTVEATTDITSDGTRVWIYPEGSYYYTGKSGTDLLRYDVSQEQEQTYIIYWTAQETVPVSFKVYYQTNQPGLTLDNPLTAQPGQNTLPAGGTWYYTYTPLATGKLTLTLPEGTTALFPLSTDPEYDGYYDAISTPQGQYIRSISKDEPIYLEIRKAQADQTFTLDESQWQQGEQQADPIHVEGAGQYTATRDQAANLWLAYTATQAGTLTISCDAAYDASNEIDYGLTTDDSLYPLLTEQKQDDGHTTYTYQQTAAVKAGDTMLCHLRMPHAAEPVTVSFQMELDPTAISSLTTDTSASTEAIYNLRGQQLSSKPTQPGLYILRTTAGTKKILKK